MFSYSCIMLGVYQSSSLNIFKKNNNKKTPISFFSLISDAELQQSINICGEEENKKGSQKTLNEMFYSSCLIQ